MTNVKLTDSERAAIATRNGVTADTPPQNVGEHVAAVYVVNPSDGSPGSPGSSLTQAETQAAVEDAIAANVGVPDDAAATSDTGSFSLVALVKRALSRYKQTRLSTAALTAITASLTTSQQLYPASAGRKIIANQTTTRAFVLLGSGTASATNYSYIVYPGDAVEDDFEGAAQVICEAGATGQINRTVLT